MTVQELIKKLSKLDPTLLVCIDDPELGRFPIKDKILVKQVGESKAVILKLGEWT